MIWVISVVKEEPTLKENQWENSSRNWVHGLLKCCSLNENYLASYFVYYFVIVESLFKFYCFQSSEVGITGIFSWTQNLESLSDLLHVIICSTISKLKPLPARWETWVQSLSWEDPLEKEMAPRSSTLAWRIPWTEAPDRLQSMGSQRVGHDWATSLTHS